jgi:undecaprenyl diphosphate synthase
METAESATADGRTLRLRLAVDYSARDAILRAAERLDPGRALTREGFERLLAASERGEQPAPPVDLLIRTGGERRLSDFMLWESAYAELHFTPVLWPDFGARELEAAVLDYHGRERRFGGLPRRAAS